MNVAASGSVAGGPEDPVLIDLIDQIARKVQAGELVDVEAYTKAHPEHADRLRRLLPAVQMLTALGHSAPAAGIPPEQGRARSGTSACWGRWGAAGWGWSTRRSNSRCAGASP